MVKNRYRVVLINPYHKDWGRNLPLGIAYLASVIENNGMSVQVIDMCADGMMIDGLMQALDSRKLDLVGVSATTPQIPNAFQIAKLVKETTPDCKVIFGGVHPSVLPGECLGDDNVDFVVRNEGELTLLELALCLSSNGDVSHILGLSYKRDGKVVHNQTRPLIGNLDNLPYPARNLFPFPQAYCSRMVKGRTFADIFTSRGCLSNCLFCNHGIFGHTFRPRSPENVIGEMEYLINEYGVDEFHIGDDNFSYDVERAIKICDLIVGRGWDIKISCSGGIWVDNATDELFSKLKRAGCYRIHFGIESGSERILKAINKGITLQRARDAVVLAQKYGMVAIALFMLGNYSENESTMSETIEFAQSLKADYSQFTLATPFPGSSFYNLLDKKGMLITKDWSKYGIYQEPVFRTGELNGELMKRMYRKAYHRLYLNPSYAWGKLKSIKSLRDMGVAFGGVKEILKRVM